MKLKTLLPVITALTLSSSVVSANNTDKISVSSLLVTKQQNTNKEINKGLEFSVLSNKNPEEVLQFLKTNKEFLNLNGFSDVKISNYKQIFKIITQNSIKYPELKTKTNWDFDSYTRYSDRLPYNFDPSFEVEFTLSSGERCVVSPEGFFIIDKENFTREYWIKTISSIDALKDSFLNKIQEEFNCSNKEAPQIRDAFLYEYPNEDILNILGRLGIHTKTDKEITILKKSYKKEILQIKDLIASIYPKEKFSRLLSYTDTEGLINKVVATETLPETSGGERTYSYRYLRSTDPKTEGPINPYTYPDISHVINYSLSSKTSEKKKFDTGPITSLKTSFYADQSPSASKWTNTNGTIEEISFGVNGKISKVEKSFPREIKDNKGEIIKGGFETKTEFFDENGTVIKKIMRFLDQPSTVEILNTKGEILPIFLINDEVDESEYIKSAIEFLNTENLILSFLDSNVYTQNLSEQSILRIRQYGKDIMGILKIESDLKDKYEFSIETEDLSVIPDNYIQNSKRKSLLEIKNSLNELSKNLDRYPLDVIKKMNINYIDLFNISFDIETFEKINGYNSEDRIFLSSISKTTFDHELTHRLITIAFGTAFPQSWEDAIFHTPESIKNAYYINNDLKGFISDYQTTNIGEDIAVLGEKMMNGDPLFYKKILRDPILAQKYKYLLSIFIRFSNGKMNEEYFLDIQKGIEINSEYFENQKINQEKKCANNVFTLESELRAIEKSVNTTAEKIQKIFKLTEDCHKNPFYKRVLGDEYKELGVDNSVVDSEYMKAIGLKSQEITPYLNIAKFFKDEPKKALFFFDMAEKRNIVFSPAAILLRANLYIKNNEFKKAEELFNKEIEEAIINPSRLGQAKTVELYLGFIDIYNEDKNKQKDILVKLLRAPILRFQEFISMSDEYGKVLYTGIINSEKEEALNFYNLTMKTFEKMDDFSEFKNLSRIYVLLHYLANTDPEKMKKLSQKIITEMMDSEKIDEIKEEIRIIYVDAGMEADFQKLK